MAKKSAAAVSMADSDKEWRARSDLRTLTEAEEIKADKARHAAARAKAHEEMGKIAVVVAVPKLETKTKSASGKEPIDRFMARRDGKK